MLRLLTPETMTMFGRVRGQHPAAQTFAYYLEYMTFHLPNGMLEPALNWLIRNKLTGPRFITFLRNECDDSALELIRQLTMRLEKEKKMRALFAKDVGA
jgi:hypothetical protein